MKTYFILILISILYCSCNTKDSELLNPRSLQAQISNNPSLFAFNELVACAAGGQQGFLDDENFPLNVFLYPELNATEFKYYETSSTNVDPLNLELFIEKESIANEPVFNGFLRRFPLPTPENDVWSRVSFIANDTLWYSKAIKMQMNTRPTQFAPELCQVNTSNPVAPIFTWEDGIYEDNIIYFHLVSTENGDALSGTYTNEKLFQYYRLDNVVFNVTRPNQAMPLVFGEKHNFTLMGVSKDNWVNLILQKEFITE